MEDIKFKFLQIYSQFLSFFNTFNFCIIKDKRWIIKSVKMFLESGRYRGWLWVVEILYGRYRGWLWVVEILYDALFNWLLSTGWFFFHIWRCSMVTGSLEWCMSCSHRALKHASNFKIQHQYATPNAQIRFIKSTCTLLCGNSHLWGTGALCLMFIVLRDPMLVSKMYWWMA
jgi:hypothetical protein